MWTLVGTEGLVASNTRQGGKNAHWRLAGARASACVANGGQSLGEMTIIRPIKVGLFPLIACMAVAFVFAA